MAVIDGLALRAYSNAHCREHPVAIRWLCAALIVIGSKRPRLRRGH